LSGLIVTHAHEDHIGAIHRIWRKMRCPIYATPFAATILFDRLIGANVGDFRLQRFNPGDSLSFKSFHVDTIRMTHSVPECVALVINTPIGKVFHTGDWKFDPETIVGKRTNKRLLESLGSSNVLAMVCDSTNADRKGS